MRRSAIETAKDRCSGRISYAPSMGMNKDQQLTVIVGALVAVFAGVGVIVAWATEFISL